MKNGSIWVLLALAALLLPATSALATDYYIDGANGSASDSNAGTAAAPWKTLAKANSTLKAGDTVYLKAGGYSTAYISPSASGTATQPIVYRNYANDNVTISNATYGLYLSGNSYVVVQGINFTNDDAWVYISTASHNTVTNCNFMAQRSNYQWCGFSIKHSSTYNRVQNCIMGNWGYGDASTSFGSVIWIGDDTSTTDHSDYNLVENCSIFHGCHDAMTVSGSHNVVRNNYIHNENWYPLNSPQYGQRCLMLMGVSDVSARNLIENNRIAYSGYYYYGSPNYVGSSGMGLCSRSNIVRFNAFYENSEPGIRMATLASYPTSPQYNTVYNNTFYQNGISTLGASGGAHNGITLAYWGGTNLIVGNMIKNNLFWKNAATIVTDGADLSQQVIAGNSTQSTDPLFVDITSPLDANNPNLPNFNLRTNSPCIDQGLFVTTITTGSGSGTTFQVAEPNYFMDGWGIVQGDKVQVQGSSQTARITSVNYQTKTVTVDNALTWQQNAGVAIAYNGSAPDLGAYEFGSSTSGGIRPSAPTNLRILSVQ